MIPISCRCGKTLQVRPEHAGLTIRCVCGRRHRVPGTASLAARLGPRLRRGLRWLIGGWLAAVGVAVLLLWGLGDRWWVGTLFLYGPRWPLLVPGILLLLAALVADRRMVLALGVGILVVIGPVLGYRSGWRGWFGPEEEPTLRIITFNMRGGQNPMADLVPMELVALEPDLVLLQECTEGVELLRNVPAAWTMHREGSLCAITRMPLDSASVNPVFRTREDGMFGLAVRYHLRQDSQPLAVVNLHLETPRRGIEQLRWGGNLVGLARNILVREVGSRRTANWVLAPAGDVIVAGDFNLPTESAIYRTSWGRCGNAFSLRGVGPGYTRVLPKWSVRIDHLLTCGTGWRVAAARVGPDLGSDHLPLIVDLVRR